MAIRAAGAAAFGAPALISPPTIRSDGTALAVDAAGTAFLLYSARLSPPAGASASRTSACPAAIFGSADRRCPAAFAGGTLLAAGAKVTAVSGPFGPTAVSDWVA